VEEFSVIATGEVVGCVYLEVFENSGDDHGFLVGGCFNGRGISA